MLDITLIKTTASDFNYNVNVSGGNIIIQHNTDEYDHCSIEVITTTTEQIISMLVSASQ